MTREQKADKAIADGKELKNIIQVILEQQTETHVKVGVALAAFGGVFYETLNQEDIDYETLKAIRNTLKILDSACLERGALKTLSEACVPKEEKP